MVHVNLGPELSSLHWVPFLDGELSPRLLPIRSPPSPVAVCTAVGDGGCLTSLNLLQGNVLSRAARWAGSSAGSFRLFWSSLRLCSIASPTVLLLCREISSWDPIWPLHPWAKPHGHHSHSPWPGTGPGAPVSLRVGLEALESSLAGAGVGIVPDGEVGLQPGEGGLGLGGSRHRDMHNQPPKPPQCPYDLGRLCLSLSGFSHSFNKHLSSPYCVSEICR